jgi:hypothetical protein
MVITGGLEIVMRVSGVGVHVFRDVDVVFFVAVGCNVAVITSVGVEVGRINTCGIL